MYFYERHTVEPKKMSLFGAKKGFSITEVPALAIVLGVVAVVLGIMATVLTSIQGTQTSGTYAYNITTDGLVAQDSLSGWQSTWVVVIAAAVILGIIYAYLLRRG